MAGRLFVGRLLRPHQSFKHSGLVLPPNHLLGAERHFLERGGCGIQTQAGLSGNSNENDEDHKTCSGGSIRVSDSIETVESSRDDAFVKYTALSNLKTSKRHDLAMVFTCKVCETRSVKTVCRESYEKGVVVVRCGGCNNLHLIADRLGWFGEPGSVEELLAARGEEVKKGSPDSLNLTLEDIVGARSS